MATFSFTGTLNTDTTNYYKAGNAIWGAYDIKGTGLSPNTIYDVYYNNIKVNDCVIDSKGAFFNSSSPKIKSDSAPGYKSDSSGKLNLTVSFLLMDLRRGIKPQGPGQTSFWTITTGWNLKIELKAAADTTSSGQASNPSKPTASNPSKPTASITVPTTTPANPTIAQPPPPALPKPKVTEKVVSDTTTKTSKDLGVIKTTTTYGTGQQTPLSPASLYFDYIQTFYIDPTSVQNSQTVSLSDIELYFAKKPHQLHNQSQIEYPGVYLYICQVRGGNPDLSKVYATSKVRKEWDEIFPSLEADTPTTFEFSSPLTLKTGEYYGIVINFEDPQFSLWEATQGHLILGTRRTCSSAYTNGKLYRASNYLEVDHDPTTKDEMFKAVSDSDLKFEVNILEYDTTSKNIELSNKNYEFLEVDDTTFENPYDVSFYPDEYVYQDCGNSAANVTFYATGTINTVEIVTGIANEQRKYWQGTNTKFISDLDLGDTIVITDGTLANTDVRRVTDIISDTRIILNKSLSFANAAAYYKITPVAKVQDFLDSPNTMVLIDSTADTTKRFIDDGINYVTFTPGQGYANTDYIVFSGGATVNARASIVTTATGNIQSINITNTGYGFTTTPTAIVYKSTGILGNTSSVITATIGSQLKGQMSHSKILISNVTSIPVNTMIPDLQIDIKGASVTDYKANFAVFNENSSTYGFSDSNYVPIGNESIDIRSYKPELLSKSLEIQHRSTLGASSSEGKSGIIKFTMSSTNPYESPDLEESLATMYLFTNIINNDTTNENTNTGNAASRHISKKINFAKDRYAEDIRVIANAWKPLGTDVKVYARIHNSKDTDAFDDKDWTELELKESSTGNKQYSSLTNKDDYVELTYGFRQYPKISTVLAGTASVNSDPGNTTVTGVGTDFTSLANGDLVVLYDSLFSNTTYAVAVVANTPVATSFEIHSPTSNVSLAAATLKVGKVNDPHQAFNNIMNDNVVRYYSTSMTEFDTYDTMAIKIVPLSTTTYIVPRVNDISVIGVSA